MAGSMEMLSICCLWRVYGVCRCRFLSYKVITETTLGTSAYSNMITTVSIQNPPHAENYGHFPKFQCCINLLRLPMASLSTFHFLDIASFWFIMLIFYFDYVQRVAVHTAYCALQIVRLTLHSLFFCFFVTFDLLFTFSASFKHGHAALSSNRIMTAKTVRLQLGRAALARVCHCCRSSVASEALQVRANLIRHTSVSSSSLSSSSSSSVYSGRRMNWSFDPVCPDHFIRDEALLCNQTGWLKMQDLKLTDPKRTILWKCQTWKWWTKSQGMKLRDMKLTDQTAGHENTGHKNAKTITTCYYGFKAINLCQLRTNVAPK